MRHAFPSHVIARLVATLDLPLRQRHELRVAVGSFRFGTKPSAPHPSLLERGMRSTICWRSNRANLTMVRGEDIPTRPSL
jgi:hypothetical protein